MALPATENIKKMMSLGSASLRNMNIGLDIGSSHVKAVALEKNGQGYIVSGFACQGVGTDTKEAIKKVLLDLGVRKKDVAISLSGHGVVLRYVNLPLMTTEDTAKSMEFELEKYIPFHRDQVNYDFIILTKNKTTMKMLVLIAAAKKELIDERVKTCQDLGYGLRFIDVDPLAIANYLEFTDSKREGVYATINLGGSVSSLDIIEGGTLVLSRDIFIGGNDFTKVISDTLGKSLDEAEEIKKNPLSDDVKLALESTFNNLVSELKVSFDFYETQANRLIDKILITGGSAKLQGLKELFKQSLGLTHSAHSRKALILLDFLNLSNPSSLHIVLCIIMLVCVNYGRRQSLSKSLLITDIPPVLDELKKVIRSIDIKPRQVII
ncbi:type IV pilus assembly protein PilM, partial [Thermoproteota archaeon]